MAQVKLNPLMRKAVIAYSVRNRRRKSVPILAFMAKKDVRDVVFVGCSPGKNANESIVELAVAKQAKVLIACDILDCKDLPWPFVQADGRDLPFKDGYTDMVLANAVIEHVGGLSDQLKFVAEQSRVARTWVITTPNRWFPVEAHTSVLFLHWSRTWRERRSEFTRLLSRSEFRDLLPDGAVIYGKPWSRPSPRSTRVDRPAYWRNQPFSSRPRAVFSDAGCLQPSVSRREPSCRLQTERRRASRSRGCHRWSARAPAGAPRDRRSESCGRGPWLARYPSSTVWGCSIAPPFADVSSRRRCHDRTLRSSTLDFEGALHDRHDHLHRTRRHPSVTS